VERRFSCITTQTPSFSAKASEHTRTSSGSRRAIGAWQPPMPKPARIAAICARSLSARKAKGTGIESGDAPFHGTDRRSLPVEADDAVRAQIGQAFRRSVALQIVAAGVEANRDLANTLDDELLMRRLDHADGDVGVAAQQVVDGVGEHEFEGQRGMDAAQFRQYWGKHFDTDHLAGADAHRASLSWPEAVRSSAAVVAASISAWGPSSSAA
jgi:hypothetical protein